LLAVFGFIVATFARIGWRDWRKARARRLNRPVRVVVVESVSTRLDDWDYPVRVTTKFEAAGRFLTDHRLCSSEESGQEFAAKYAVGSSHEVIPSLEPGDALLPEDFRAYGTDARNASFGDWVVSIALILATIGVFAVVIHEAP
jgi:hypothetical protein